MSDRFDADQFVRDYKSGTARLTAAYGYNPAQEMDSCGVGLVVALDGKRRRDVVAAGIDALKAVWHRGAVDADGKTGDGAGLHVEIPQDFFKDHVRDSSGQAPEVGRIAVGMVFLPRTDFGAQERCRIIVETEILRFGHTILGWRQVPVDISVIGEKANATRPEIEQILIGRGNPQLDNREFEKQLYILRRRMEKAALAENIGEFYVCSLVVPLGRLQGHVPGRASVGLLPRPARRALHLALRHLPPALFDQHLPAMEAGPAVPRAGAQRRDQHHPGQRQLDEEPRGAPRARRLRPGDRGPEAHHPARGVGFLRARQRVRAAGARPSQPADGQADDDPRGLVLEPQRAGQAPRDVQLRERRHGAVGRAGRHRRRRRQVGAGRHGPQRAAARCATCAPPTSC